MSVPCHLTFSVSQIHDYSTEHEATISPHCISNVLKVSIFCFWACLFSICWLLLLISFITSARRKRRWNPTKRNLAFLLGACTAEVIRYPLHLSGTVGRGLYFLYLFPDPCLFTCILFLMKDWFKAATMIERSGNSKINDVLRRFNGFLSISALVIWGSFGICKTLGPMIFYENPDVVNWCVMLSHVVNSLSGIWIFSCALYFAHKLRKAIMPAFEVAQMDNLLLKFVKKLDLFTTMVKMILPSMIPVLFLPVWFKISPTLDFAFVYEYFLATLIRFSVLILLMWFLEKRKSTHDVTSSRSKDKETSEATKPSVLANISIDELNGVSTTTASNSLASSQNTLFRPSQTGL